MISSEPRPRNDWLFILSFLAILLGFILSILSMLTVCSLECAETHYWRLFGMPFEYVGIIFFIFLLAFHLLSLEFPQFNFFAGLLLAGGLGAEAKFLLLQKYRLGNWCPLCLTIAACIFCAALCYSAVYFLHLETYHKHGPKREFMKSIWKGIAGVVALIVGFFIASLAVSQFNPLAAAENTIKEGLFFGEKSSPIEVYFFTDWACPACRQLEPELEKMAPDIMKKGKLTFVDHAIHTETLNYSPYNVSFMLKNKPEYLKIRKDLIQLSTESKEPTLEEIEKIAAKNQIKYVPLNFSDIALSQKYFKDLATQFGIKATPTVIVINAETKKGKKLIGFEEINEANILKAIDSLNPSK